MAAANPRITKITATTAFIVFNRNKKMNYNASKVRETLG
jgi:hypothetical protein